VEDMKKISIDERPSSTVPACAVPTTAAQIVIESKAEARKRGVKSAERAEIILLAYYAKVMNQADAWIEFYRQQAEANQRKEKTACNAE
jgi:hypothetical protein